LKTCQTDDNSKIGSGSVEKIPEAFLSSSLI
jgi:hypothetical protein